MERPVGLHDKRGDVMALAAAERKADLPRPEAPGFALTARRAHLGGIVRQGGAAGTTKASSDTASIATAKILAIARSREWGPPTSAPRNDMTALPRLAFKRDANSACPGCEGRKISGARPP
jgi:hypothetical protein